MPALGKDHQFLPKGNRGVVGILLMVAIKDKLYES